jgi:hypothetical protein
MVRRFSMEQARNNIASGLHYLPAGMNVGDLRDFGTEPRCVPARNAKYELSRSWNYKDLYFKFSENDPEEALQVTLPLVPYKGYSAMLDDGSSSPIKLKTGHDRLLSFVVPAGIGSGTVTVSYRGTLVQDISLLASAVLLGGLCFIGVMPLLRQSGHGRKKKKKKKKKM